MDKAGDVAEAAEGDIDEGVSGADADFDPYCWSGNVSNVGGPGSEIKTYLR
jgi:hypothetical protein